MDGDFIEFWTHTKVTLAFLLIGTPSCLWSFHILYWGLKSRNWPSTDAEIISEEIENELNQPLYMYLTTTKPLFKYRPSIAYKYTFKGQDFIGDQINFGFGNSTIIRSGSKAFLKKHIKNKTLKIHFDPSNPQNSVVKNGIKGSTIFVAILILALGIFLVSFSIFDLYGYVTN